MQNIDFQGIITVLYKQLNVKTSKTMTMAYLSSYIIIYYKLEWKKTI